MRDGRTEPDVLRHRRHAELQRQHALRIFRRRGDHGDRHVPDVGDVRAVGSANGEHAHATTSSAGRSSTTRRARRRSAPTRSRRGSSASSDGTVVFDQTIDAAFGDPAVQAAVADAEAAVAAAGGPGTTFPTRPRRRATRRWPGRPAPACSRSTTRIPTLSTTTTFGPATILIGDDTTCAAAVATLPSARGRNA